MRARAGVRASARGGARGTGGRPAGAAGAAGARDYLTYFRRMWRIATEWFLDLPTRYLGLDCYLSDP